MIDGDAIKPGARRSFTAKLIELAEGFEEHVVRGVLGFLRIAEKPQREVINRAAMFGVKVGESGRRQTGGCRIPVLAVCQRLIHERIHGN